MIFLKLCALRFEKSFNSERVATIASRNLMNFAGTSVRPSALAFPHTQALYHLSELLVSQNDDESLYARSYGDCLDSRRN